MALADLLVRIGFDTAAFSDGLAKVNADINKSVREAEKSFGGISKAGELMKGVGLALTASVTAPLVGLGAAAIKAFADIDSLKRGLNAIEGSAQKTESRFRELMEVAKLPGLGIEEAVRGDIRLRAIGLSADISKRALMGFGNALASVGSGKADLDETIRQFGQLASASTLTAENLKPIIERVPQAGKILREAFGTANAEQLRAMGVTVEQVVQKLLAGLDALPKQTSGIKNAFENISDAAKLAFAQVGEAMAPATQKILDFASAVINDLVGAFKALPGEFQIGVIAIGAFVAAVPPAILVIGQLLSGLKTLTVYVSGLTVFNVARAALLGFIAPVSSAIAAFFSFQGAVSATSIAMGAFTLALRAIPWAAATYAAVDLTKAIWDLYDARRNQRELEEQDRRGTSVLVETLRQQGFAVDEVKRKYDQGLMKPVEYAQALRVMGIELGKRNAQLAEHSQATGTTIGQVDRHKAAIQGLIRSFDPKKPEEFLKAVSNTLGITKASSSAATLRTRLTELNAEFLKSQDIDKFVAGIFSLNVAAEKATPSVERLIDASTKAGAASIKQKIAEEEKNRALSEQREYINKVAEAQLLLRQGLPTAEESSQRITFITGIVKAELNAIEQAIRAVETQNAITTATLAQRAAQNKAVIANMSAEIQASIRAIDTQAQISAVSQVEHIKDQNKWIQTLGKSYGLVGKSSKASLIEVSTVITNMSQGISQAIVNWNGFGNTAISVLKQTGQAILSNLFQNLLKSTDVLKNFDNILKGVIRNFSGGAASSAAQTVGGSLGGVVNPTQIPGLPGMGGASNGASSAVSAGLSGVVGMVTGIATAVSSVIGNFQMAGMNKSLDIIVKHTLQTANDLANLRADEFVRKDEYFRKLDDLFRFTWVKLDDVINSTRAIGTIPAAAGGNTTFQINGGMMFAPGGEGQFIDWLMTQLRARGARI